MGLELYYQNCMACHGDYLDGHGHYAHGFNPPPSPSGAGARSPSSPRATCSGGSPREGRASPGGSSLEFGDAGLGGHPHRGGGLGRDPLPLRAGRALTPHLGGALMVASPRLGRLHSGAAGAVRPPPPGWLAGAGVGPGRSIGALGQAGLRPLVRVVPRIRRGRSTGPPPGTCCPARGISPGASTRSAPPPAGSSPPTTTSSTSSTRGCPGPRCPGGETSSPGATGRRSWPT
jgi:hypothetical protein